VRKEAVELNKKEKIAVRQVLMSELQIDFFVKSEFLCNVQWKTFIPHYLKFTDTTFLPCCSN
jgi:hypothetical protein